MYNLYFYRVLDYHKVQCTANRQEVIARLEIVRQSKYLEEAGLQIPCNYHATAVEYGELINKGLKTQMKGEI